jgi:hypothetical protein
MREQDHGYRRKATRSGRMKGCYIYIPAERLQEVGVDPQGPTPRYRVWSGRRGSLLVTLYPEA